MLHLADLGFKQISVEPVVGAEDEEYALQKEDLPEVLAEYDKLAAEMARRSVCSKKVVRLRVGYGISGGHSLGRSVSLSSVCRGRKVPDGQCLRRDFTDRYTGRI